MDEAHVLMQSCSMSHVSHTRTHASTHVDVDASLLGPGLPWTGKLSVHVVPKARHLSHVISDCSEHNCSQPCCKYAG